MILSELKIHHLRNIFSAHLLLNPRFNLITGPNGCGKTSILEALYLLSCARSFRFREVSPIVSHDQNHLVVFGRSNDNDRISIQKSRSESTQIKLNDQVCPLTSQLAYALPCQIFYSDIFELIDGGSSARRSMLDWGLFHVKHDYLSLWKRYKKILKQRNALLKTQAPYSHFIPWDKELSQLADELDCLRSSYFTEWQSTFMEILPQLSELSCSIRYYKGWDRKNSQKTLEETLKESFVHDKNRLSTHYGPHQADILIEINQTRAKQILSRGQQKIVLMALKLSQGLLVSQGCLYLLDDLSAELDEVHEAKLLRYLTTQKGQFVITSPRSLDLSSYLPEDSMHLFSINDGNVSRET